MTRCFASLRPRCPGWFEPSGFLLAVSAAASCIASASAQTLNWMTPRWLNGQQGHAMAYDIARQRVVLFGGTARGDSGQSYPSTSNSSGTWEWDGSNWTQRAPVTSPSWRRFHAMVYDSARQRVVLFGGDLSAGTGPLLALADTWEWDGSSWTQRTPATSPGARSGHAMAYDVVRQRVVLFGGRSSLSSPLLSDTWEWDGNNWTQQTTATSPGGRFGHAMAYDLVRQRVVLFGGYNSTYFSDTWEWDGSSWTQRTPATSPGGRFRHAMAYDLPRQRVVLFGGSNFSDTWEWDGSSWTQQLPATSPSARSGHAMAYDLARQRVVLFSGSNSTSSATNDTWEWDGNNWTQRPPATSPGRRARHAMAYDFARQRVVLFGGEYMGTYSDTWEWDGSSWMQQSPATSPSARSGHAVAYDLARQRVVLFGGENYPTSLSDTWEWDGNNWTQQSPATSPSARYGHAMAYDVGRQRVVLFGGGSSYVSLLSDTWEWDGSSWTQQSPATSPSARYGPAMAYDLARQRVVLFSGAGSTSSSSANDTWEWDGNNWTQRTPATSPPGWRTGHAMAYDITRQRIVMFGGRPVGAPGWFADDTWEWDGNNWTQLTLPARPIESSGHAMAYDDARQRVVLFGGAWPHGSDDTWLFGPLTPAEAQPFGTACAGSSGPPVLASNVPYLSTPGFALDLLSARAASPCAFGLSAATQSLPIGPCTLLLQDTMLLHLTVTDSAGFATTPAIALPLDITLRGLTFYAQAAVVDPQATLGLAFTAGLRLVLGD